MKPELRYFITVGELIEELKKSPLDAGVYFHHIKHDNTIGAYHTNQEIQSIEHIDDVAMGGVECSSVDIFLHEIESQWNPPFQR